jgi:tetratricopeptide (TPR) repeat protein
MAARTRCNQAMSYQDQGRLKDAGAALDEADQHWQALADAAKQERSARFERGRIDLARGELARSEGRHGAARECFEAAVASGNTVLGSDQADLEFRMFCARAARLLAVSSVRQDQEKSTRLLAQAETAWRQMAIDFPDLLEVQQQLLATLLAHVQVLNTHKNPRRARLEASRARQLGERLAADHPDDRGCREMVASALDLSIAISDPGDEEVETLIGWGERAVAIFETLYADSPHDADRQCQLGAARSNLALVLVRDRRFERAAGLLTAAIAAQQTALAVFPQHQVFRTYLATHYRLAMKCSVALGQHHSLLARSRDLAGLAESPTDLAFAAYHAALGTSMVRAAVDLSTARRAELEEDYGAFAVRCLRDAYGRGFTAPTSIERTRAFGVLRQRPDFQQLAAELASRK